MLDLLNDLAFFLAMVTLKENFNLCCFRYVDKDFEKEINY